MDLPKEVETTNLRLSAGTAMYLNLMNGGALEVPTTAYLMIPGDVCRGRCTFCPQARGDSRWLSRVSWPEFDIEDMIGPLTESDLQRICLQCPDVPGYEESIVATATLLSETGKPISISAPPLSEETLVKLDGIIDRIGIGIDGATDDIRASVKRNYDPQVFWDYLGRAISHLGPNRVTAHFIVGLGENLPQLTLGAYRAVNAGADVSLFSYMSKENGPDIRYYRQAQIASHLLKKGRSPSDILEMLLDHPEELVDIIAEGEMFRTQGCPGCNRPYYTTRPGQEHRNYPRALKKVELDKIKEDLSLV